MVLAGCGSLLALGLGIGLYFGLGSSSSADHVFEGGLLAYGESKTFYVKADGVTGSFTNPLRVTVMVPSGPVDLPADYEMSESEKELLSNDFDDDNYVLWNWTVAIENMSSELVKPILSGDVYVEGNDRTWGGLLHCVDQSTNRYGFLPPGQSGTYEFDSVLPASAVLTAVGITANYEETGWTSP